MDERELLSRFVSDASHDAFQELVRRHAGLVYSAAQRQLRDTHLAEDAAQAVFLLLARKAHTLKAPLAGWLVNATYYTCRDARKVAAKRQFHERRAAEMKAREISQPPQNAAWEVYAPNLDAALSRLTSRERDSIALRFLSGLSLAEVALSLGITEMAAQKCVHRAVLRLRKTLTANTAVPAVAALTAEIAARSAQAAPPGLIQSITANAASSAPNTLAQAMANKTAHTMAVIKIKTATLVVLAVGMAGAGTCSLVKYAGSAPALTPISSHVTPASPLIADTAFECGSQMQFAIPSPDHLVVTLQNGIPLDWWMFRLRGVAGKTVRIDIQCGSGLNKWSTLNPVWAQNADLDDPATYVAGPSTGQITTAHNVILPSTDGQNWHYIADANLLHRDVFTMTQTFTSDTVWIANRVPHPPGYNEKFIAALAANPLAKVIQIGRSTAGRPLLMVQIGPTGAAAAKSKPCLLIAAGEQAFQPDGMWAAQGAIEYLLGNAPGPATLRRQCTFLIIPDLDPDGTAQSRQNLPGRFSPQNESAEAIAYANFFQNWVDAGNRLDAVFEIHSLQSNEAPHLTPAYIEQRPQAAALDRAVVNAFISAGLRFSPQVQVPPTAQARSMFSTRFGGWLTNYYGPLDILYEINAQDPVRHLDLMQLKATGALFAQSAGQFLTSPAGADALAAVDAVRANRRANWANIPPTDPSQNALESEPAALPTPADADSRPLAGSP